MTGSLLVNNLAGLLIITSLLVIAARKPTVSAALYALQSLDNNHTMIVTVSHS